MHLSLFCVSLVRKVGWTFVWNGSFLFGVSDEFGLQTVFEIWFDHKWSLSTMFRMSLFWVPFGLGCDGRLMFWNFIYCFSKLICTHVTNSVSNFTFNIVRNSVWISFRKITTQLGNGFEQLLDCSLDSNIRLALTSVFYFNSSWCHIEIEFVMNLHSAQCRVAMTLSLLSLTNLVSI